MAVNRNYQIPQAREALAVTRNENGEIANIYPTREYYRWMSLVERMIGANGPLANIEDDTTDYASNIANNANAIDLANTTLAQTNTDLATTISLLSALATQVSTLITDFNNHIALTTAHGSNGSIVGSGDVAALGVPGLVQKGVDPLDSAAATVPALVVDHNNLLAQLRTAGII